MKGLKEALAQTKELRHPLHDLLDLINTTPADMIKLKFEQGEDGSKKFNIEIPSRAEQAKQKAMQQALQQGQQPVVKSPGSVDQMMGEPQMPSANVSKMPSGGSAGMDMDKEKMPAAAASKIPIKIAMTPEAEEKLVKTEFPNSFIKSMGLE